jgi:hypothetical protein
MKTARVTEAKVQFFKIVLERVMAGEKIGITIRGREGGAFNNDNAAGARPLGRLAGKFMVPVLSVGLLVAAVSHLEI